MQREKRRTGLTALLLVAGLTVGSGLYGATFSVSPAGLAGDGQRLLNSQEGRAIVAAARKHRKTITRTLDCSHLAHEVFALAGFGYDYSPSDTIFRGMRGFQRVKKPQPGDLVVWRGHVGIVVDPEERSFYSWRTVGPAMVRWDSRYWRSRGERRFYRRQKPK